MKRTLLSILVASALLATVGVALAQSAAKAKPAAATTQGTPSQMVLSNAARMSTPTGTATP